MLLLLISLDKLSKNILSDRKDLHKDTLKGKELMNKINNKSKNEINDILLDFKFIDDFTKYCVQDCISLWHIFNKVNSLIFVNFSLNVHNFSTLPSLAFGIFKAHFFNDVKIPIITGDIFNKIKKAYTGGHVDVYNLYNIAKKNI